MNVSRRNFVAGAAATAAAATAGLAGVASIAGADEVEVSEITQRLLDRGVAGADLPNAQPIPPVAVPEVWDDEVDVVVIGLGGGGLTALNLIADQGLKVIGIDKDAIVGGSSRHACSFVDLVGGTKGQIEFGFPGRWEDDKAAIRAAQVITNFSMDEYYLRTLLANHVEAVEYVVDQPGMQLASIGRGYHDIDVIEGRQNRVLGMNNTMNTLEKNALEKGADIRLMNQAEAFVVDNDRVVGVMVDDADGKTRYIKAEKGIVLTAGGIGMNKDLIKAYMPSVYEGAVLGGPMPTHTGEVFRMGLGVGADFAGFDSWCCWEGAIDETTCGGDGQFWHYFWHGERQMFHNPWLLINKYGQRLPYLANTQEIYQTVSGNPFDLTTTNGFVSTVGHKAYSICDSNYATDIFKKYTTTEEFLAGGGDGCRIPLTDPDLIIPEADYLVTADWQAEVEQAVERGAVKKADTLEELAEMIGLDPEVVVKAVEDYNALCEKGVDDEMAFPYDPSWLTPVAEPPFYAALVGGQIGKSNCGLRVNDKLQVTNEEGKNIAGLYAGWSTSGGLHGEGCYGSLMNGGMFFGGVGSSIVTGYIAAKMLLENE